MKPNPSRNVYRRVYPLDPRTLTQEQIAVTFAMTSRRPEAFDDIAKVVSEAKAADFHEKWVLNYGHASVAEHAILHLAVENVSRLACDDLEDNRLASYTEKSSRYQLLERGSYHVPTEFRGHELEAVFTKTCDLLFDTYQALVPKVVEHLKTAHPRLEKEKDAAYELRLQRLAAETCRFLLPAATLTNVGVTMNARTLEHAVTKLLSSYLAEERELGEELKAEGKKITPTLIKYADRSDFLASPTNIQRELIPAQTVPHAPQQRLAVLVQDDPQAEKKVVAALMYRLSGESYQTIWDRVQRMAVPDMEQVLDKVLGGMGPHDTPPREFEHAELAFDLMMDYGAYREFKRHRMQSYVPQPLAVSNGYVLPDLIAQAGCEARFRKAIEEAEQAYRALCDAFPPQSAYIVTHAHYRRVLARMNIRECYHLFKLRTSPDAHPTLRKVMLEALESARAAHPLLFKHLRLRQ